MSTVPPNSPPAPAADPAAPPAGTDPAVDPQNTPDPAPTDPPAPADPPTDPVRLAEQLKAANAEAAKRRTELRDAQARLKQFEEAQLTEQQKLEKRAQEAEAARDSALGQAREALLRAEITAAAATAGIQDVSDARLLLPSVGEVEWDAETGDPTNVADLVKKLVEAKPYLVAVDAPAPRPPAGRQGAAPAAGRSGRWTADAVRAMSPQQIAALSQADYDAAMAALGQ